MSKIKSQQKNIKIVYEHNWTFSNVQSEIRRAKKFQGYLINKDRMVQIFQKTANLKTFLYLGK